MVAASSTDLKQSLESPIGSIRVLTITTAHVMCEMMFDVEKQLTHRHHRGN